jgi:hypothetical protein
LPLPVSYLVIRTVEDGFDRSAHPNLALMTFAHAHELLREVVG